MPGLVLSAVQFTKIGLALPACLSRCIVSRAIAGRILLFDADVTAPFELGSPNRLSSE